MLYKAHGFDFTQHVHPSLRRRIRTLLILSVCLFALAIWDIYEQFLTIQVAAFAIVVGAVVGFATSRIFHLSWKHDGSRVVGRVDLLGWIVLIAYVAFEAIRTLFFETVLHLGSSPAAITYVFVASALVSRVFGLRGRIVKILKDEKVFAPLGA